MLCKIGTYGIFTHFSCIFPFHLIHFRLLSEVVMNFQVSQEEVTLIVNPQKVSFKNYVEDEPGIYYISILPIHINKNNSAIWFLIHPDPNKVIHTVLDLAPEEFDSFQTGIDTDITFCLKELRVRKC